MSERTCARCSRTPTEVEFRKDRKTPDGLGTYCKPCDRAKAKAYRAADSRPSWACSVENCDNAVHARDLCAMHYKRRRKTGTTEKQPPRRVVCSIEDCESRAIARGWCNTHYKRWHKYGDPAHVATWRLPPQNLPRHFGCSVDACEEKHFAKGMCHRHYSAAHYRDNREQHRVAMSAYRALHAEEARERSRKWREADPERAREAVRRYASENREHLKAKRREYRNKNRDLIRALNNRRKALKRNAPINDLTGIQWREIKAAYGQRCAYCGKRPKKLTMDHVVPLSKGGSHTASNILPACGPCNFSKNAGAAPTHQPLLL